MASLITSIAQLKHFCPSVVNDTDFSNFKIHIENAEIKVLLPVLGLQLFNELISAIKDPASPLAKLVPPATAAVAYQAILNALPFLPVKLGNMGKHQYDGEDYKATFRYQDEAFEKALRDNAINAVENLYKFIEDNKADFPTAVTDENLYFIKSAAQFQENYNINNSLVVYYRLKNEMKIVQDLEISVIFTAEGYSHLLKGTGLNAFENVALMYIKTVVAHYSAASLALKSGMSITEKGFIIESVEASAADPTKQTAPEIEKLNNIIAADRATGDKYFKKLREFMSANFSYFSYYTPPVNHSLDYSRNRKFAIL